ncbi:Putative transcription factor IWR1 [Termitomyces sp. J132]|nr:Putative transcription factor IWR1 [Termitomyces sp. J132]
MEVDTEDAAPHPLTIVRIKRKRNEEPLDALVIESRVRRKKSRGMGVFKFAQTVEKDAWEDEQQAKQIQDQISRLTREAAALPDSKPSAGPQYVSPPNTKPKDEARHYTVLSLDDYDDQNSESSKVSRPVAPRPKILAAKDLPPKNSQTDFKMFDAVLTTDKLPLSPMDSEMEKFLPMLNDYLKLHDVALGPPPTEIKGVSPSNDVTMQINDDYVWDVFYHRPATLSEWNEAANVATLSGLPLSITNSYESTSESEEEDEADEDSNAEEYYKNDYPEDEDDSSSGSDNFHEHSDKDDIIGYDE